MPNLVRIDVAATDGASSVIERIGDTTTRTSRVVVSGMGEASDAFQQTGDAATATGGRLERASGSADTFAGGLGGLGDALGSVMDVMASGDRRAAELARAHQDVEQASLDATQALQDMEQAERDLAQAGIDAEQAALDYEQALLDQKTAQDALNEAIREHGKNSDEAKQAQLDLTQANIDLKQSEEDLKQASQDQVQAELDAQQAVIDHTDATLNLADAQRNLGAQSGVMGDLANWTGILSGVLGGLVGIIGTVTAVQWAWNIAMSANPIGLVIAGIILLVGVIVLIATKTTWFQDIWNAIWGAIGDPVKATIDWIWNFLQMAFNAWLSMAKLLLSIYVGAWNGIKKGAGALGDYLTKLPGRIGNAFKTLSSTLTWPFRTAFNAIARLWNGTVGRLSFSVPAWVPGIGGNGFSMPRIPQMATGGDVMRSGLAFIHAGERVSPAHVARRQYTSDESGQPTFNVTAAPGAMAEFTELLLSLLSIHSRGSRGRRFDTAIVRKARFSS